MAGAMKLFSFNRKYCHVVGIYPPESNRIGLSMNSRNWVIIIGFVPYSLSSTAFFFYEAKSMLEYGTSFLGASAGIVSMCMYIMINWQMEFFWPFIENCERFIEKRVDSINAYRELIDKIERLCEWLVIACIFSLLVLTLPFLFYTLINYYIFDSGEASFLLLFPATWPFDWKTPLGYFVAWLFQAAGIFAITLTGITILNSFFGPCWLFIVMTEDITKDLAAFNEDVKNNAEPAELKKRFCDIIQFYSDAKECIYEFNAIVKHSLFTYITWLMLSVTSMLLTLQFQLMDDNAKLFETFVIFVIAFWVFGILFFMCEIGQRVTNQFEMFGEEVEQCDWHNLPIEMQRIYLLFLSDVQQPKNISCFVNIVLSREAFKQILNTGYSYFNTIRQ